MNAVVMHDEKGAEGRRELRSWEWYMPEITVKGKLTTKNMLFKPSVIITSFEVFMVDIAEVLKEIPFLYIVVDEAHRLKNKQTKTLSMLQEHPCKRILLLTGTPIQNNTKELFTIMNFIESDRFPSLETFMEDYGNLETAEQVSRLGDLI